MLNVELLGHERHIVCQVADQRWTIRQSSHEPLSAVGDEIDGWIILSPKHFIQPVQWGLINQNADEEKADALHTSACREKMVPLR